MERLGEAGKENKKRRRKHRARRRKGKERENYGKEEGQTVFQDDYKISHPTHPYNGALTLLPSGDGIDVSSPGL